VLKDILKPREPVKVEEKKEEEEKPNLDIPQGEKFEYAPELTIRKIKTEDNRHLIPRKQSKTL
jgi:hypothetical protein